MSYTVVQEPAFDLQIQRESLAHTPGEAGWQESMEVVHDALSESDLSHSMPELGYVDPGMAFQEYENNGQGGLDALLTALDGSSEVNPSFSSSTQEGSASFLFALLPECTATRSNSLQSIADPS